MVSSGESWVIDGYPLVFTYQKTNWKDPPCYEWENSRFFRLGHGFYVAFCMFTRGYDWDVLGDLGE